MQPNSSMGDIKLFVNSNVNKLYTAIFTLKSFALFILFSKFGSVILFTDFLLLDCGFYTAFGNF